MEHKPAVLVGLGVRVVLRLPEVHHVPWVLVVPRDQVLQRDLAVRPCHCSHVSRLVPVDLVDPEVPVFPMHHLVRVVLVVLGLQVYLAIPCLLCLPGDHFLPSNQLVQEVLEVLGFLENPWVLELRDLLVLRVLLLLLVGQWRLVVPVGRVDPVDLVPLLDLGLPCHLVVPGHLENHPVLVCLVVLVHPEVR